MNSHSAAISNRSFAARVDTDAPTGDVTFPINVALRDGTPGLIWPLLPTDGAGLAHGYAELSPRSRERRFLTARAELGPDLLELLVDDVDQQHHVAFVLVALPPGRPDAVVGVGRLIQDDQDLTTADIAITVHDGWQGRGVGGLLADALVRHRPAAVARIVTVVATDNSACLAMLHRLGPTTLVHSYPGVYEVRVRLVALPLPRDPEQDAGVGVAA